MGSEPLVVGVRVRKNTDEGDEQVLLTYHIEQAERVEEASLSVLLLLLHNLLLLLRPPPPHLRFGWVGLGQVS